MSARIGRPPRIAFTEKQERNIADAYVHGESSELLGRNLGVHGDRIRDIVRRSGHVIRTRTMAARQHTLDEHFFDRINTERKAYFLGFIYADGCVSTKTRQLQINLQAADRGVLAHLRDTLRTTAPIRIYRRNKFDIVNRRACFTVTSSVLVAGLHKHGAIDRKTHRLRLPRITRTLMPHFIRGYFDGDGCIYIHPRDRWGCQISLAGHPPFLTQIRDFLCKELGFRRNKIHARTGCAALCYSGRGVARQFRDWIYKNATTYLIRKWSKFEELLCR